MILIVLTLCLIGSVLLAFFSIRRYQKKIQRPVNRALFLIQKPRSLNLETINKLHKIFSKASAGFSIEKLTKGKKSALIIFAPSNLIRQLSIPLGLIELEDYSRSLLKDAASSPFSNSLALQIDLPSNISFEEIMSDFDHSVTLGDDDQIWWQVILYPKAHDIVFWFNEVLQFIKHKKMNSLQGSVFHYNLRLIIKTADSQKSKEIYDNLVKITSRYGLDIHRQTHSKFQLIGFYLDRLLLLESKVKFFHQKNFFPPENPRKFDHRKILNSEQVVTPMEIYQMLSSSEGSMISSEASSETKM